MRLPRPGLWISAVALLAALLLLVVPVRADYLANVDWDLIGYNQALCGPPLTSMFGDDPDLQHEWADVSPWADNAPIACQAAAGKRVAVALVLVAAVLAVALARSRRSEPPLRGAPETEAAL